VAEGYDATEATRDRQSHGGITSRRVFAAARVGVVITVYHANRPNSISSCQRCGADGTSDLTQPYRNRVTCELMEGWVRRTGIMVVSGAPTTLAMLDCRRCGAKAPVRECTTYSTD